VFFNRPVIFGALLNVNQRSGINNNTGIRSKIPLRKSLLGDEV